MLTEGGISPTHVGLHVSNYMYHFLQYLKRQCIPPHGDANIDVTRMILRLNSNAFRNSIVVSNFVL
jgi:hypothetical protein